MQQHIAHMTFIVDDYDKAIGFFTKKLSFDLLEDTPLGDDKRWVRVSPKGSTGFALLLAKAVNDEQRSRIGNQTGGRVFLFLYTDDLTRDHTDMIEKGIEFVREPVKEAWGTVAVFKDLYGNLWDLLEPKTEI